MVFYDRIPVGMDVSQVIVDDYIKSFFMVEQLIRNDAGTLCICKDLLIFIIQWNGLKATKMLWKSSGFLIDTSLLIKTGVTIEAGRQAAEQLLNTETQFDSIFAFTDTQAIGAMNYLRGQGIKIPQDVAIASFSGTILSTIVILSLLQLNNPSSKWEKKQPN